MTRFTATPAAEGRPADPAAHDRQVRLAVLNIQRTCVHDGPGVRTTVFLRGCPLRCQWCHNPEARAFASPTDAESHRAVADILAVVARDRDYYARTHGGITLSGGEPLAQAPAALLALLRAAKADGLHVAVETAGDVPWRVFETVRPFVDHYLFDLKVVGDPALHRRLTGRPGRRITANLRRLAATGADVQVRMCVVPGCNDTPENFRATAELLRAIDRDDIELMRVFDVHRVKARALGLPTPTLDIGPARSLAALREAKLAFDALGIRVHTSALDGAVQPVTFTPRIQALKKDIRDAGYAVCIESAELKTEYCRRRRGDDPLPVRRAGMLRHLLNRKKVQVYPNELLVGNFTSKRVAGNVWVEYFGAMAVLNLWNIDRQTPVAFQCSPAEKTRFYTRIAPYWLPRSLYAKVFPRTRDLLGIMLRVVEKRPGFNNNMAGIAHFIVNCERWVRLGTAGIAAEADAMRAKHPDNAFYDGVLLALKAVDEFAARYADRLRKMVDAESDPRRRAELAEMAAVCDRVPHHPATTFHEALQSILFLQIALCTESFENAISLGRLDQVLDPFYRADVAAGRIDREAARELVACFVLKLDEVIFVNDGDRLFQLGKLFESLSPVETVTVGGTDRDGRDATNDVTYMILDACELRPIGINMAARIHRDSPPEYVERIARVYLSGSPMPALYNDEVYVPALRRQYGNPLPDARNYGIVGCVEPVASDDHFANTDAANVNVVLPFLQALEGDERPLWKWGDLGTLDRRIADAVGAGLRRLEGAGPVRDRLATALRHVHRRLPGTPRRPPRSMDELMTRFDQRLRAVVRDILADQQRIETALGENLPTPLASSLYTGCMASGRDAYDGGTRYNTSGIQAVGVTDVADSLAAIDELVFRQRRYTLAEVLAALEADFQGKPHERLHRDLLAVPKFGDDAAPDAAAWMNRVLGLYVDALRDTPHPHRNGRFVAGYYGLNVNRIYGMKTPALPSGRRRGEPLANSLCPHFGMRMVDLTSSLNAVARVDFARYAPNGTTLTPTIDTGLFPGDDGPRNLAGLIRGFFDAGGMQFQPNLVSRDLLLDAYENPGKHKDLVVRIAGYCAYFDDLSDELKREIINRSYYGN